MGNSTERILLVDDTTENLDVLNGLLTNYKRNVALNGVDALKLAKGENKPDLILLDIMMPVMDGYETCKKLKEDPVTKDIPVIFMTALNETVNKLKGFEIGAIDYVTKPFEPLELLKRIETHLQIARLQKDLKNQNILLEEKVIERTKELVESNKNLIIEKEKAEAANNLKSVFLAQMSHEIRTPINIIVSYASFLTLDDIDESIKISLKAITNASKRLTRTMDLIINLSEIISGSYSIKEESFNIYDEIISPSVTKLGKLASEKNVEIIVNGNIENSQIFSDRYAVHQIFTQIFENAIIFTDKGTITINLQKNENEQLIVEIVDTGIGISEEYLPKIFEEFTQEEMGYTRKYDGNGIGLTIVQKYCELIGATIEVESEKGVGSKFRLTFKL